MGHVSTTELSGARCCGTTGHGSNAPDAGPGAAAGGALPARGRFTGGPSGAGARARQAGALVLRSTPLVGGQVWPAAKAVVPLVGATGGAYAAGASWFAHAAAVAKSGTEAGGHGKAPGKLLGTMGTP